MQSREKLKFFTAVLTAVCRAKEVAFDIS